MKSIILSFILSLLSYTAVFAQLNELPSTEKKWEIKDYKDFNTYLEGISFDSYPSLKNKETKAVFQKILAGDYKETLYAKDIDLNIKMPYLLEYQKNIREIFIKYLAAEKKGNDFGIEVMHLQGTIIYLSSEMVPLIKEFLNTLDKNDESYQVRVDGIKQAKHGLKQQLEGTLVSIKDRRNSSDKERIILSEYFVDACPRILNFLDASNQKEFKAKIVAYLPIEPNKKVKVLLGKLLAKL